MRKDAPSPWNRLAELPVCRRGEWLGEDIAGQIVGSAVTDPETAQAYIAGFEEAGADELIFFPVSAGLEQVDLLADATLSGAPVS